MHQCEAAWPQRNDGDGRGDEGSGSGEKRDQSLNRLLRLGLWAEQAINAFGEFLIAAQ